MDPGAGGGESCVLCSSSSSRAIRHRLYKACLEYRLLPLLSPFVALLLAGPADLLPEEAAHELCLLLPQRHRAEVAQHIAGGMSGSSSGCCPARWLLRDNSSSRGRRCRG